MTEQARLARPLREVDPAVAAAIAAETNRQHTHHGPRGIERSHRCLKARLLTTLASTEQIILRYAAILVDQFGSLRGPQAHLLLNAPDNETWCPLGDDKRANAFSAQVFINRGKGHN